jgi:hypothetical protein
MAIGRTTDRQAEQRQHVFLHSLIDAVTHFPRQLYPTVDPPPPPGSKQSCVWIASARLGQKGSSEDPKSSSTEIRAHYDNVGLVWAGPEKGFDRDIGVVIDAGRW